MIFAVHENPHILTISVLQRKPNKEYALSILKDISARVSYLMKKEHLKTGQLLEFYPKDKKLLGMNINYGAKIMLRLRDPWNENKFLSREVILQTMLHELTHNLFGPHCANFYAKLDSFISLQLVIEQKGLYDKFIGEGRRLGLKHKGDDMLGKLPRDLAGIAAQKRAVDSRWCGDSKNFVDLTLFDDERQLSEFQKKLHKPVPLGVEVIEISEEDSEEDNNDNHEDSKSEVIFIKS